MTHINRSLYAIIGFIQDYNFLTKGHKLNFNVLCLIAPIIFNEYESISAEEVILYVKDNIYSIVASHDRILKLIIGEEQFIEKYQNSHGL